MAARVKDESGGREKPGSERTRLRRGGEDDLDSDLDICLLEDDSSAVKKNVHDLSDDDLNDDLLWSDEDDQPKRTHDASGSVNAIVDLSSLHDIHKKSFKSSGVMARVEVSSAITSKTEEALKGDRCLGHLKHQDSPGSSGVTLAQNGRCSSKVLKIKQEVNPDIEPSEPADKEFQVIEIKEEPDIDVVPCSSVKNTIKQEESADDGESDEEDDKQRCHSRFKTERREGVTVARLSGAPGQTRNIPDMLEAGVEPSFQQTGGRGKSSVFLRLNRDMRLSQKSSLEAMQSTGPSHRLLVSTPRAGALTCSHTVTPFLPAFYHPPHPAQSSMPFPELPGSLAQTVPLMSAQGQARPAVDPQSLPTLPCVTIKSDGTKRVEKNQVTVWPQMLHCMPVTNNIAGPTRTPAVQEVEDRLYMIKLEEQRKKREEVLRQKELGRQQQAMERKRAMRERNNQQHDKEWGHGHPHQGWNPPLPHPYSEPFQRAQLGQQQGQNIFQYSNSHNPHSVQHRLQSGSQKMPQAGQQVLNFPPHGLSNTRQYHNQWSSPGQHQIQICGSRTAYQTNTHSHHHAQYKPQPGPVKSAANPQATHVPEGYIKSEKTESQVVKCPCLGLHSGSEMPPSFLQTVMSESDQMLDQQGDKKEINGAMQPNDSKRKRTGLHQGHLMEENPVVPSKVRMVRQVPAGVFVQGRGGQGQMGSGHPVPGQQGRPEQCGEAVGDQRTFYVSVEGLSASAAELPERNQPVQNTADEMSAQSGLKKRSCHLIVKVDY
ncbi:RNA-binding protein 33-like isoform X2 [Denticeps clupeoides]|uniref:RNA-binding protein 33-like isoform X2 n=1 Tax=Denticeps clupeoides TaxID=299321 RepID=UPI0010A3D958|nr:RNA-binding protein 33-like isoform X2 [Denticeps clupeoides]